MTKLTDGLSFWAWDAKEALELIEWMRNYNLAQNKKPKIHFYGFERD